MSMLQVAPNPDLKRLRDEGYEIEVDGAYLLVHGVPYVTAAREVKLGILVSDIAFVDVIAQPMEDHIACFVGDFPCDKNGNPIEALRHGTRDLAIQGRIVSAHSFSNRPPAGYRDYYEKLTRYATIISNEARSIAPEATAQTFRPVPTRESESVFLYPDSASSRAGVDAVAAKLCNHRVGIVGLGGTGSYVLDLVAKTWVREIHTFDDDYYLSHNAFRSPGATSLDELRQRPKKVIYWRDRYATMRRGIIAHPQKIDATTAGELDALDFVFVCVDKGPARKTILQCLVAKGTPCIDVGMGVQLLPEKAMLRGTVRVTAVSPGKTDHLARRVPVAEIDDDDPYAQNIQIAELNSLNASLAVIRWKKHFGLYHAEDQTHHITYSIDSNEILNEEFPVA